VIQTGPNTELGGVKVGFLSPAYQVAIAGVVKMAPMPPAPSQATILTISLIMSAPLMSSNSLEGRLNKGNPQLLSSLVISHGVCQPFHLFVQPGDIAHYIGLFTLL